MLRLLVNAMLHTCTQNTYKGKKFIEQNDISFCNAIAAMSLPGAQTPLGDIAVKGVSPQLNEPLYTRPVRTVV
jgi:hypothetical protein